MRILYRTREGFILVIIDVKEVRIQERLHDARKDGNRLEILLSKVSVDPVRDVQRSVYAQSEKIMGCNSVGLSGALEHE